MKGTIRRTLGILLGLTLLTATAMAEDFDDVKITLYGTDEVEVQSSILTKDEVEKVVREKLDISADYTLESADVRTDDFFLKKFWNLYFYKEGNSIDVQVNAETGDILTFDNWESSNESIVKLTEDEALEIAIKYLKENYPEKFSKCERISYKDSNLYDSIMPYYDRDDYNFLFVEKKSNELLYANNISISVSGVTEKIRSFAIRWDDYTYTPKSSISLDEVKTQFYNKNALQLVYIRMSDDENNNGTKVIPVYQFVNDNSQFLDANTGEFISNEDIYMYYGLMPYAAGMGSYNVSYDNAKSEEKAAYRLEMIPEEGVISREKAEEILLKKLSFLTDTKDLQISYSDYRPYYDGMTGQFWRINFENSEGNIYIRAYVDAKTGDVLNINYSNNEFGPNIIEKLHLMRAAGEISEEEYKAGIEELSGSGMLTEEAVSEVNTDAVKKEMEQLISKMFPEIKPEDYILETKDIENNQVVLRLTSDRLINDIPFKENGISIEYNISNKKISDLSITWSYNLDVSKPSKMLTEDEVNKLFYDTVGFEKFLIGLKDKEKEENEGLIVPKDEVVLVYVLNPFKFSYIDASSGKLLNYYGQEFDENKEMARYFDDIKGHKYERVISIMNKMRYINAYDTKFNPNSALDKKDAIKWIVLTLDNQYKYIPYGVRNNDFDGTVLFTDVDEDDEYYYYIKRAIEMGIIENKKTSFFMNKNVTRLDYAKWIINGLGQKSLAEHTDIFKASSTVSSEDTGYAALADFYGLLDNGSINGLLTRGSAVNELYELLLTLENSYK